MEYYKYYDYPVIKPISNSNLLEWSFSKGIYLEIKKEHEKYIHEYYEKFYNQQFDYKIIIKIYHILSDIDLTEQSKIDKINLIIIEN